MGANQALMTMVDDAPFVTAPKKTFVCTLHVSPQWPHLGRLRLSPLLSQKAPQGCRCSSSTGQSQRITADSAHQHTARTFVSTPKCVAMPLVAHYYDPRSNHNIFEAQANIKQCV